GARENIYYRQGSRHRYTQVAILSWPKPNTGHIDCQADPFSRHRIADLGGLYAGSAILHALAMLQPCSGPLVRNFTFSPWTRLPFTRSSSPCSANAAS